MVDPTGMNEKLERQKKRPSGKYGKTFWTGLLGGLLGGGIFLALKGFARIDSFPFLILSGIGVMALYLYFMNPEDRKNSQKAFLFVPGLVSLLLLMFFFILLEMAGNGDAITLRNVTDAYFHNQADSAVDSTLLAHLLGYFFVALGIGGSWLYLTIQVPRWEKKHGRGEESRVPFSERKKKKGRKAS